MREIALDTETTGTDHREGDRIISLGLVEMIDGIRTGEEREWFCNPLRAVGDSFRIHGISDAFLTDKPVFAEIWPEAAAFIGDARLVIHNAAFDVGFLNMEYARLGADAPPAIVLEDVVDTLHMARRLHPGTDCSLDGLLKRYGIGSKAARGAHGALKDARLLADIYAELCIEAQGGRQRGLDLSAPAVPTIADVGEGAASDGLPRQVNVSRLTDAERASHAAFVASLGPNAIWLDYLRDERAAP